MGRITINVKASNDKKYSLEIDTESTVQELKQQIQNVSDIEPTRQRLIYSGRVLSKDDDKIETYKVKEGNTIHLVQSKAPTPASDASTSVPTPQIPMNAGTSAANPLEQLSGARYAGHNIPMPSTSMFGPDGGMTGSFGGAEDMSAMLEQPGVREAMDAAFSNPAFIDQMMNSNPQLRDAPPYVRQMLQSPEFRRQMLDPNFIRQANQMQRMMYGGGASQQPSFPAPGSANDSQTSDTTRNTTGQQSVLPDMSAMLRMMQGGGGAAAAGTPAQTGGDSGVSSDAQAGNPFQRMMSDPALMQQMQQMMGMGGFGAPPAQEPADTRPPEERYAEQLRQLNDMGFFEFDRNVNALRRAGGSVQGAIEALLNGSI